MKHHGTAEGETRQVPEVERLGNLRQVPLLQRLGLGPLVVVVAGEEDEVVRLAVPATPRFPAILPFSMASCVCTCVYVFECVRECVYAWACLCLCAGERGRNDSCVTYCLHSASPASLCVC